MRRHCSKILLIILLAVLPALPVGAEPSQEDLSRRADSFLMLLDQGLYKDAWQTMSALFQAINDQDQWQRRHHAIRTAYGALSSRQIHLISERQTFTLSPDGQYVIVQFKTIFANKAGSAETLVFDCRTTPECSIREYIIR